MSAVPQIRIGGSTSAKPKPKRPNAVRRIMNREESRERRVRESSVAAAAAAATPARSNGPKCKNDSCPEPNVIEGVCQTCGAVADDSNIVSEVAFGEASNGAAILQGSNFAADQAGVRPTPGNFRRVPGAGSNEARLRSQREAKTLISQYAHLLGVTHLAEQAVRYYNNASNNNFVQGRRKHNVAAICLYAACRQDHNNNVMLIDLADIVKTDVFLLGRGFKDFMHHFPQVYGYAKPLVLEDLIHRFALKLEFLHDTNKVALSAVRIAKRMQFDYMTHGRRPAGICGAALIMAARAHNYRRTVREVVYIAKVTMATLQERMEEFANVPFAQMTVNEFNKISDSEIDKIKPAHDPPFVYKQSEEWKEKHPSKSRKRSAQDLSEDSQQPGEKRQRNESGTATPVSTSQASASPAPVMDKDGFVVPPLPQRVPEANMHDGAIIRTAADDVEEQLETLVDEFGDVDSSHNHDDMSSEMRMAAAQGISIPTSNKAANGIQGTAAQSSGTKGKKKNTIPLPLDEAWVRDEAAMEQEMEEALNNPVAAEASAEIARALENDRAQESSTGTSEPPSTPATTGNDTTDDSSTPSDGTVNSVTYYKNHPCPLDDPIIHENEFENDPEFLHALLGEEEIKFKEQIWINHNKDYLRELQQKEFTAKIEATKPKKSKPRSKKPKIGEGQGGPADSAEEAAMNMMQTRSISTRINYSNIGQVFSTKRGPASMYNGSTSSVGGHSAMASEAGSDDEGNNEEAAAENAPQNGSLGETSASHAASTVQPTGTSAAVSKPTVPAPAEDEDEGGGEDDYEEEETMNDGYDENRYEDEDFQEEAFDPFADNYDDNGGEDDEY